MVTRDEAGRIRSTGDFALLAAQAGPGHAAHDEGQAEGGAEALIERVLSRSLSDWGIGITTDDATGRGG